MASSVVVTDFDSLSQNFAENSKQVLCSAAFGAGAYAIGGALLGFPPLSPAGALVTGGSLLAALALCPNNANGDLILGSPPNFVGGQCLTTYNYSYSYRPSGGGDPTTAGGELGVGPISVFEFVQKNDSFGRFAWFLRKQSGSETTPVDISLGLTVSAWTLSDLRLSRQDGLPDNCGDKPRTGGQIVRNPSSGDTLNPATVVDNRDYSTVIPVEFNLGGISSVLNLSFGPIRIGSLFPLNFNIKIGDSDYKFKQRPDGVLEPVETSPDPDGVTDRIEDILKEIRGCVCTPAVDLDMLLLPTVSNEQTCSIETETLLVPKGSVSDAQFERFVASANLAKQACENNEVEQLPMELIYSASTTQDGREIFTGKIKPEVVSLFLKITEIRDDGPEKINLYQASNQRKFGSVSFVTDGVVGGGDYIYIFDQETYIPLPRRGKEGRLRILMKKGLTFEVYDAGERL